MRFIRPSNTLVSKNNNVQNFNTTSQKSITLLLLPNTKMKGWKESIKNGGRRQSLDFTDWAVQLSFC
jgi:hypothetical protein